MGTKNRQMDVKAERLQHANHVLRAIGSHGRRFFYSRLHDRYAEIILDDRGRLRVVDEHTGKPVLIVDGRRWRGFSHDGTCQAIIQDLARYVRTGRPTRNHYGLWPEWICENDLLGYGDAADLVRLELRGNPAVPDTI